jgi:hypothetical protein
MALQVGDEAILVVRMQLVASAYKGVKCVRVEASRFESDAALTDERREVLEEGVMTGELVLAVGHNKESGHPAQYQRHMPEELDTRRIGPVEILKQEEYGADRRQPGNELFNICEQR